MKQFSVTSENWTIISDIVEVAIIAADGDIKRRARCDTPDRRKAELAKIRRRIKRSGKNKSMSTIEQAAGSLAEKVSRNQRIRSIYDSIVCQMGKCIGSAERERETFCLLESLAKRQGQTMIEAVSRRNQLLDVSSAWIRSQMI